MALLLVLFATACVAAAAGGHYPTEDVWAALDAGDECQGEGQACATSALQLRKLRLAEDDFQGAADAPAPAPELLPLLRSSGAPAPGAPAPAMDADAEFVKGFVVPLMETSAEVKAAVRSFLVRMADANESQPKLLEISDDIRKLVAKVVPKVIKARDASNALDKDPRPKNTSEATVVQNELVTMQKYWAKAWPVIIDQAESAFVEKDKVVKGIAPGIKGSLDFLKPVLGLAWKAEKYMMPVVEDLLNHTGSSSPTTMAKAQCASDYAEGLGVLTVVYQDLKTAQKSCNGPSPEVETCTKEVIGGLANVASAIESASKAIWMCFGISWACAEIMNSVLKNSINALAKSVDVSFGCSKGDELPCSPGDIFTALASLTDASTAMDSASMPDSCGAPGTTFHEALNPHAATPADLKVPSASLLAAEEDPVSLPMMLQTKNQAAPTSSLNAVTASSLERIVRHLRAGVQQVLAETLQVSKTNKTNGLVPVADTVLQILGADVPKLFDVINQTSAVDPDPNLEGIFGGKAKLAEEDLLTMLAFTLNNAPKAIHQVTGAAEGSETTDSFLAAVNVKVQEASTFLGTALDNAWRGLSLQLPRIDALSSEDAQDATAKKLSWAECAANYATSLGQLTSLYSDLVTTGVDCDTADEATFDKSTCEADLFSAFGSIQNSISTASVMMQSCFNSNWKCLRTMSAASRHMLEALKETITIKLQCQDASPMAVGICESTVYSLLGNLGNAANRAEQGLYSCSDRGTPNS